jgi:glycerol uptake facilitator-like aquaporin
VYIVAQIVGALLGFSVVHYLMGITPTAPIAAGMPAGIAEGIGACILVFTVTRVVIGKVPDAASGLAIGAALVLAITISQFASGGILNPALAISLSFESLKGTSYWLVYIVAPIIGGLFGSLIAVGLEEDSLSLPSFKKTSK